MRKRKDKINDENADHDLLEQHTCDDAPGHVFIHVQNVEEDYRPAS